MRIGKQLRRMIKLFAALVMLAFQLCVQNNSEKGLAFPISRNSENVDQLVKN